MSHNTYEELRRTSDEIVARLKDPNLTPGERQQLEALHSKVAGSLMSVWLPPGLPRRIVMALLLLVGIYGFFGNRYALFAWLLLPLFSPRLVGTSLYLLGRIFALFR